MTERRADVGTVICWSCLHEKEYTDQHFRRMPNGDLERQCWDCVRSKNAEHSRASVGLPRRRAQRMAAAMRYRAKGLPWHSDLGLFTPRYLQAWLRCQPNCPICGRRFDIGPKHDQQPKYNSPSLDRIRTNEGYTALNTALICWRCNSLKKDGDVRELSRIVDWLERTT